MFIFSLCIGEFFVLMNYIVTGIRCDLMECKSVVWSSDIIKYKNWMHRQAISPSSHWDEAPSCKVSAQPCLTRLSSLSWSLAKGGGTLSPFTLPDGFIRQFWMVLSGVLINGTEQWRAQTLPSSVTMVLLPIRGWKEVWRVEKQDGCQETGICWISFGELFTQDVMRWSAIQKQELSIT